MLTILYSSNLKEERDLASKIKAELDTTIKSFVRRADDKYGKALQNYLQKIQKYSENLAKKYASKKVKLGSSTKLVEYESEQKAIDRIITSLIYEQSKSNSFDEIQKIVKKLAKKRERENHYRLYKTKRK